MKTTHTYIIILTLLSTSLYSCQVPSDEGVAQEPTTITGHITRADGSEQPSSTYNIHVTAKLNLANYLNGVASTMAAGTGKITFNTTIWYYPLNNSTLKFYAYTGTTASDLLTLNSGSGAINDVLLSNNGGAGTPGSATNQVSQLDFSHIMTKLDVSVVTASDIEPTPSWTPAILRLTMNGVAGTGKYNITSAPGALATATSGSYTINLGTNYLVPTGGILSNKLTSLIIDNYTASAADLAKYTITPSGPTPSIVLSPGLAYKLIFTIKRLHLESITLALGSWTNTSITNDNVTYTLQSRILNLGSYAGGDVTKVIVTDNNDEIYTGTVSSGKVSFILAPSSAKSVSLYTADGLLITTDNGITLNNTILSLSYMNEYGMLPEYPTLSYDGSSNPYAVSTPIQFKKITSVKTYSYKQTGHLNLGGVLTSTINMAGSYDGNGYQINGVNMSGTGVFKEVYPGQTVKNVRITSGCITQSGSEAFVGGICGKNSGTIVACVNEALIVSTAAKHAGGICGDNAGVIIACMNGGDLKSIYGVGSAIGGICGYNSNTTTMAIISVLNVGQIKPTGSFQNGQVAGICGISATGGQISTAYWLTGTSEPTIGATEVAANGASLSIVDAADMSQQRIRETETLTLLNSAIPSQWSSIYTFTRDKLTWPMPVKN